MVCDYENTVGSLAWITLIHINHYFNCKALKRIERDYSEHLHVYLDLVYAFLVKGPTLHSIHDKINFKNRLDVGSLKSSGIYVMLNMTDRFTDATAFEKNRELIGDE